MRILTSVITIFNFITLSQEVSGIQHECCLCNTCGEVYNEDTLIELNDDKVITCKQLESELRLFEQDSDRCVADQETFSLICCTDQNTPVVELILDDDFDLDEFEVIEDDDATLSLRVSRFLWSVVGKTSNGYSYNKPTSTYKKPTYSRTSTSGTSSSNNSGKCHLCYDKGSPSKLYTGVVVGHYAMKYTGSCIGLDNKLKTMASNHQMCKVCQAQFQRTCGC